MDKFFRSFLKMKWKIKGEWVSFLDALLFVAITGSGLIMRLALMWGLTGWYWMLDYAVAAAAAVYVKKGTGSLRKSLGAYSFFVIMPTLMMASAYWGQADSLYVLLVLAALVALGSKKWGAAAVLYALALLLNVQAVFVLPLFGLVWLCGTLPTGWLFLVLAALAGRLFLGKNGQQLLFGNGSVAAAERILREYAGGLPAAEGTVPLSDSWANVYQFLHTEAFAREFLIGGILFTVALLLVIAQWFFVKSNGLSGEQRAAVFTGNPEFFTELALFFALLLPFTLPHMNARCGLLADCLALLLLFFNGRKGYFALVQLLVSFSMYQQVLAGISQMPAAVYAAAELILIGLAGMDLYRGVGAWKTASENV